MKNENSIVSDGAPAIELYGSFHLGDIELVIPVASLQEVVNYPSSVTQSPLAPPHLLGLFNLRGTLIPILDLRQMLCLGDDAAQPAGKIAIVEAGDARVGLLFDTTGEILRVPATLKVAFDEAGQAARVICGALKLDGGDRILPILSVSALFGMRDVPQLRHHATSAVRRAQQAQRHQGVSFRVADVHLALPMGAIQEIIRVPALNPSPLADEVCVGMLNLRGTIVPVIDFARLTGAADKGATPSSEKAAGERRIVVLNLQEMHFGLLVDRVSSIVSYRDDELLAMPAFSQRHVDLFAGCLVHGEAGAIILLKPDALCGHARVAAIANGHRTLYSGKQQAAATSARARSSGARVTCVTFHLTHLYGVPIRQLCEVIEYPEDLVRAPGMPSYVPGVLSLRRELITVVDVRSFCEMPAHPDPGHAKVLVVEHRGEKFGLVVDALDNIVTIDAAARIKVPAMLMRQAANALSDCLKEAVELPGRGTLMLLDLAALCARLAPPERAPAGRANALA